MKYENFTDLQELIALQTKNTTIIAAQAIGELAELRKFMEKIVLLEQSERAIDQSQTPLS